MTDFRWYEAHGWDNDPLMTLKVVHSNGHHVDLGWLVDTDDGGWEYVHATQEISDVIDLPGLSLEEAKTAAETMVRLRCTLTQG